MKSLIHKLNRTCKKALEASVTLCVAKGHYNIEVEHFLLCLLEQHDSDIHIALRHYALDKHTITKQVTSAIDKVVGGNTSTPAFSKHLLTILEQAWLLSSLQWAETTIRSGSILAALVDNDMLRGLLLEISPLLLRLPRTTLKRDMEDIIRQSTEQNLNSHTINSKTFFTCENEVSPNSIIDKSTSSSALETFTTNLTEKARRQELGPVFGREREMEQILHILSRHQQNNPILLGDSGVGKTAIIEGLAQKIVASDVPQSLAQAEICALDMGKLLAGISLKGEFENRLKMLLEEVEFAPHPIILFIDEAHNLMGAGSQHVGLGDAANLLKPLLARKGIHVIAATTWEEYKRHLERDAALARRFERVYVKEPTSREAMHMLHVVVERLKQHHQVAISCEAVEAAVTLSQRFLPERRLPDKALRLLDTASAQVSLSQKGMPLSLQQIISEEKMTELELNLAKENEAYQPKKVTEQNQILHKQLQSLSLKKQGIKESWQEQKKIIDHLNHLYSQQFLDPIGFSSLDMHEWQTKWDQYPYEQRLIHQRVDDKAIARVLEGWTGIPMSTLLSQGGGWIHETLTHALSKRIVGQQYGIKRIVERILQYQAGLVEPSKPIGTFFLTGPSGVGKTETALALSEILMGQTRHLVRLNMNEFQEVHSLSKLKGAPPGYIGYGKGGTLTEAVRRNPYSVILMDEIDKAHPDVLNLFYQVFDQGRLEDGDGLEVDFSHTLFVLTSNDGSDIIQDRFRSLKETEDIGRVLELLEPKVVDELNERYGVSFINRTLVIPYLPIQPADISQIITMKLQRVMRRVESNHKTTLIFPENLAEDIAQRFQHSFQGMRAIDAYIDQAVLPRLTESLLNSLGTNFSGAF